DRNDRGERERPPPRTVAAREDPLGLGERGGPTGGRGPEADRALGLRPLGGEGSRKNRAAQSVERAEPNSHDQNRHSGDARDPAETSPEVTAAKLQAGE